MGTLYLGSQKVCPVITVGGTQTKYGCTVDNLLGDVDVNGKLQTPSASFSVDFSGVEDLANYALYYKFYQTPVSSVNLSDLTTISGTSGAENAFAKSSATSVDLSSLETVTGSQACYQMFNDANVVSADLSKLKTVSGSSACSSMLRATSATYATLTSINLSLLETVGTNGCQYMLAGQVNLPVTFNSLPKLKTISGSYGMSYFLQGISGKTNYITSFSFPLLDTITVGYAFQYCFRYRTALQHIYFNAIKTTSFGSVKTQFNNMLSGITGCTLHFPSNVSTQVAALTGYPNFGGTSTTVLFDLTATS